MLKKSGEESEDIQSRLFFSGTRSDDMEPDASRNRDKGLYCGLFFYLTKPTFCDNMLAVVYIKK